jgi:predicted alpha/beta-hydrolase family hydrolase
MAWLTTGDLDRAVHLMLAHGAGAPMTSPFLETMARLLDDRGITVHRFEFGYMAGRREGATRRPAPRAETLVGDFSDSVLSCRARIAPVARLFIGGKSMGGRIACLAAAGLSETQPEGRERAPAIQGVVVLGFPLHPPRKPRVSRAAALSAPPCPVLVVQGTRDPFGGRNAFAELTLQPTVAIHWIEDGDHDLAPRRASGRTQADALAEAADAIAAFMDERQPL